MAEANKRRYYVYMLRLGNGHLYTGYTDNVDRRMRVHAAGKGSRCVRSFAPVMIERVWRIGNDRSTAMKVESLIKAFTRPEKEHLIGFPARLRRLAADRKGLDVKPRIVSSYSGRRISAEVLLS
jgi:putative endonuclease